MNWVRKLSGRMALGLVLVSLLGPISFAGEKSRQISVGFITEFPQEDLKEIQPLMDYLSAHLKNEGIQEVHPVFTASAAGMGYLFRKGKVDFLIESPATTYAVQQMASLNIILRQWKGGHQEYRSVIFVKEDSPVKTINDLKGKVIVLKGPYSTSGFWLPKFELAQKGLRPYRVNSLKDEVPPNRVGYLFSYDNQDGLRWVQDGLVAAAAVDEAFLQGQKKYPGPFRVLYRSAPWLRQVVSARGDLPGPLVQKFSDALIHMEDTPEGRQALKKFQHTTRFEVIPGGPGPLEASLKPLRAFIRKSLGLP